MTDMPKLNGRNWLVKGLLQIALALAAVLMYSLVDDRPGPKPVTDTLERIVRLEECVRRLQTVPEDVVYLKTRMDTIATTLDKVEKKLDSQR